MVDGWGVVRVTNVYVVDDEPHIRHIFRIALERAGFRVRAFDSGHEFLRQRPAEPDLVLMDLTMPRIQGDEVIRVCRERWLWRRVRFCLVTGSLALTHDATSCADMVLEKPVSVDTLIRAVLRLIPAATRPTPKDAAFPPPDPAAVR